MYMQMNEGRLTCKKKQIEGTKILRIKLNAVLHRQVDVITQ
jgi:hypothetical protein